MQKMHWCTGKVNLSGQNFTIIVFDPTNPISWPEAQVLMLLHGSENVFDIKPYAVGDTTPLAEKERLALKYGYKPTEQVFPGRMPRMEMTMPAESEDLPLADERGALPAAPVNGDAAASGNTEAPMPPPESGAVFKPGKHAPPR